MRCRATEIIRGGGKFGQLRTAGLVGLMALLGLSVATLRTPAGADDCSSAKPIERVSVSSNGQQGDGRSELPATSADGCVVAFKSFAANLIGNDRNDKVDVFVRDRRTGLTERVTVSVVPGQDPNGSSSPPALDATGNFVAFGSDASNLIPPVPGDFNNSRDVFLYDRTSQVTRDLTLVVNVNAEGSGGGLVPDAPPSLSAAGTTVAFTSAASDLVPGHPDEPYNDVFVCTPTDCSGTIEIASVPVSPLSPVNGNSGGPALSRDQRIGPHHVRSIVAFYSDATNLIDGDTNAARDVFVRDRSVSHAERVSISNDGAQADAASALDGTVAISSNGCLVAFSSDASNLVAGTPLGITQIYVRDRCGSQTLLVSKNVDGEPGNGPSHFPSLSADGRFVAFPSGASNLLLPDEQDTNSVSDVFVVDLALGGVRRVSVTDSGQPANAGSFASRISADGTTVAFQSDAALVADDTNGFSDIYAAFNALVLTPLPTATFTISSTPTITLTPTITPTITATPSPTRTMTPAVTPTATITVQPTGTSTVSPTATKTSGETPTVTPPPTVVLGTATATSAAVPTTEGGTPTRTAPPTTTQTGGAAAKHNGGGGCSCRIDAGSPAPSDFGVVPALGMPFLVWMWRKRLRRGH